MSTDKPAIPMVWGGGRTGGKTFAAKYELLYKDDPELAKAFRDSVVSALSLREQACIIFVEESGEITE